VLDGLADAILLVDQHDRIVYLNLAAIHRLPVLRGPARPGSSSPAWPVDQPLGQVWPDLAEWIAPPGRIDIFRAELRCGQDLQALWYDVHLSPFRDPVSRLSGRLVSLHNAGQRGQMERRRNQEVDFALAARLQEASEFERRQIAGELHDQVGQNLTGLNINLNLMRQYLQKEYPNRTDPHRVMADWVDDSLVLVEETTRQVRGVLTELVPPMLDEFGLNTALNWYCTQYASRTGIKAVVIGDFQPRLAHKVEMALFRIVQEALYNVAKYAGASGVNIHLEKVGAQDCLRVEDNGRGMALDGSPNITGRAHWGLLTMRERAASIGGELVVQSEPGQGTCVIVTFKENEPEKRMNHED
jgi:signal transduction histidine kinase